MSSQKKPETLDSYLIVICITVLAGFVFVFQVHLNNALIRYCLLASFTIFAAALCLLLWWMYRLPKREALLEKSRKAITDKFAKRIKSYTYEIAVPYAVLKTRKWIHDRMHEAETPEDREAVIADIQEQIKKPEPESRSKTEIEADEFIIESFVAHMAHEIKDAYRKAFRAPLEERNSRAKFILDMVAFKFRRHIFVIACVLLGLSIVIKLLME